jgi:hypothetical protein
MRVKDPLFSLSHRLQHPRPEGADPPPSFFNDFPTFETFPGFKMFVGFSQAEVFK